MLNDVFRTNENFIQQLSAMFTSRNPGFPTSIPREVFVTTDESRWRLKSDDRSSQIRL